MKLIYEVWLSPSRTEVYHHSSVVLNSDPILYGEDDFLDSWMSGNVFELFGEDEQDGLWKVVCEVEYTSHYDPWNMEWDGDTYVNKVIYKSRCKDFKQLREVCRFLNIEKPKLHQPGDAWFDVNESDECMINYWV